MLAGKDEPLCKHCVINGEVDLLLFYSQQCIMFCLVINHKDLVG